MTRDDLFSHCPSCGSRLNTHPDRVCSSCQQKAHEQDCATQSVDIGMRQRNGKLHVVNGFRVQNRGTIGEAAPVLPTHDAARDIINLVVPSKKNDG